MKRNSLGRLHNQKGRYSPKRASTPRSRNKLGRYTSTPPVSVYKESEVPKLESLIRQGPVTWILIHADWCGPCQMYKPMWTQFEQIPGRCVNMARVHHDMLEKVPTIKKAKIRGYPSVIKVEPSGAISEYVIPETGEKTNAVPFMREQEKMKELLTTPPPMNSGVPGTQEGIRNVEETLKKEAQIGGFVEGSVLGSLASAVQAVGPTALLLFANTLLPKGARSTKTYKSPKRSSRRASTRRNRSNA